MLFLRYTFFENTKKELIVIKIKSLSIEEIIPYENNPRNNDRAVPYVAESIKKFGFKVPIIIDKNNVIITGHTRYKAALKLGLNKIPCILADDLSDEQIKAFRLADNKVSEFSTWETDKLLEELEGLNLMEFEMESFGFEPLNIDIDSFFSSHSAESTNNKKQEQKNNEENEHNEEDQDEERGSIVCPHCGETIDI